MPADGYGLATRRIRHVARHVTIASSAVSAVPTELVGTADVGIVGIGVMGGNLALNLLDRGFTVAIWNLETDVADKFVAEHAPTFGSRILAGKTYEEFALLLKKPRKVLLLVTAGKPTDMAVDNLTRVLEREDIIVDTGNTHFKDTAKRGEVLEAKGFRFLGMGISGGAEGARKGPAFFPGGTLSVWEDIKHIVEAAAAKATDGRPCVTMCGRGGAGSCVKMYHNAGEYAVLQIWAEACAVMRNLGLDGNAVKAVLASWKARGDLDSYMLDITHEVVAQKDTESSDGSLLVDHTADMIGSKGTGLWSVQEAMGVGVPVPSLAQAVLARQMSMCRTERLVNESRLSSAVRAELPKVGSATERKTIIEDLYWAVYLSMLASYAQMFQAVRGIDKEFGMEITRNLPRIISTFRAGCILQGALLEPMTRAFEDEPEIPNLLCAFRTQLEAGMPGFRATCARLASGGEAASVMQASLSYISTMSQGTLHAGQVVSLQRDVFGRHGFKRLVGGRATEEIYNATWKPMIP